MKQVGVSLLALTLLGGGFGPSAGAQPPTAKSKGVSTATHVRVFEGAG